MLEGIKNWRKKARRTAVTQFAAASGLSYIELVVVGNTASLVTQFAAASGLLYSETDRNAIDKLRTVRVTDVPFDEPLVPWPELHAWPENMLSGRWQGLPVAEADFSTLTVQASTQASIVFAGPPPTPWPGPFVPKEKRFSAVIADLPATLPDLMIQRKIGLGGQPLRYHIESGYPEFNREWRVTTANTAFAAKLIDASMITWLLSVRNASMFKLYGRNLLLVWSYLLPAPGLGAIFDTAKSFTDHIPRQIWAEYGTH